jgi:hypothetical protein
MQRVGATSEQFDVLLMQMTSSTKAHLHRCCCCAPLGFIIPIKMVRSSTLSTIEAERNALVRTRYLYSIHCRHVLPWVELWSADATSFATLCPQRHLVVVQHRQPARLWLGRPLLAAAALSAWLFRFFCLLRKAQPPGLALRTSFCCRSMLKITPAIHKNQL